MIKRDAAAYAFLVPWAAGLILLVVAPLGWSLYLSFTDYDLLSTPEWVGFGNYLELFTEDDRFLHSILITGGYVLVAVPLQLAAALAAALLLVKERRGKGLYRSLFYLPSLLAASVAVSITWRAMFDYGGPVNGVLGWFGVDERSWINDPSTVIWTIVALEVWRFGAPMVIFLAGLKQIPGELYEAAALDGAGRLRKFVSVTVPMLSPIVFFNLLLGIIGAFQTFAPAQLVGDGNGGPADSTLFYALNLYQQGFDHHRMGYASAMAWLMLIALAVVAALLFRSSRRWVHYGDDTT
ncbi:carbohydrate ABC transporter permease [Nonomuraea sp. NPDC051941]|uniref:carbohydrate ABC transporter permease n=1 Tax=Nonomuraea sp. NPDC051941 TaxID=3364373 RepID=UPI0037CB3FD6